MAKTWASKVKVKEGALKGWTAGGRPADRRKVLARVVRTDGYATVVRRLNYLVNVSKDEATRAAARADMEWLRREYRGGQEAGGG